MNISNFNPVATRFFYDVTNHKESLLLHPDRNFQSLVPNDGLVIPKMCFTSLLVPSNRWLQFPESIMLRIISVSLNKYAIHWFGIQHSSSSRIVHCGIRAQPVSKAISWSDNRQQGHFDFDWRDELIIQFAYGIQSIHYRSRTLFHFTLNSWTCCATREPRYCLSANLFPAKWFQRQSRLVCIVSWFLLSGVPKIGPIAADIRTRFGSLFMWVPLANRSGSAVSARTGNRCARLSLQRGRKYDSCLMPAVPQPWTRERSRSLEVATILPRSVETLCRLPGYFQKCTCEDSLFVVMLLTYPSA